MVDLHQMALGRRVAAACPGCNRGGYCSIKTREFVGTLLRALGLRYSGSLLAGSLQDTMAHAQYHRATGAYQWLRISSNLSIWRQGRNAPHISFCCISDLYFRLSDDRAEFL